MLPGCRYSICQSMHTHTHTHTHSSHPLTPTLTHSDTTCLLYYQICISCSCLYIHIIKWIQHLHCPVVHNTITVTDQKMVKSNKLILHTVFVHSTAHTSRSQINRHCCCLLVSQPTHAYHQQSCPMQVICVCKTSCNTCTSFLSSFAVP